MRLQKEIKELKEYFRKGEGAVLDENVLLRNERQELLDKGNAYSDEVRKLIFEKKQCWNEKRKLIKALEEEQIKSDKFQKEIKRIKNYPQKDLCLTKQTI